MRQGVFDDLPGKGKPQQLVNLKFVPKEQRAAFMVLSNSGLLPPEMELRKEMADLQDQLPTASEEEKAAIIDQIREKKMYYDILMERRK